ncbi:hypothetical protein AB0F43_31085 [Kribbella sp. NPDC023972]|uniref:hypothetical protein n=1 Tax=Kribbella sp. NPDC023972 TaxID=3154795 RepID=UPI003402B10E
MRAYLSDLPRWVEAALAGVPFGIAMGLFAKLDGAGWLGAGFVASSGIPFGLMMAWWGPRWRGELERAEADVPPDKLQVARRAASRGPVPEDPEVRAAAVRIASAELTQALRNRKFMLLFGGVVLIAVVGAAAEGSLWALLYAFVAAVVLYFHWYRPRQLRRRIELLGAAETGRVEP